MLKKNCYFGISPKIKTKKYSILCAFLVTAGQKFNYVVHMGKQICTTCNNLCMCWVHKFINNIVFPKKNKLLHMCCVYRSCYVVLLIPRYIYYMILAYLNKLFRNLLHFH